MHYLLKVLILFVAFVGIDALWISVIAKDMYFTKLAPLLWPNPETRLGAWIIVRIALIIGIIVFVWPKTVWQPRYIALGRWSLFGFLTYAVYDLTNYTFFKERPLDVTIIDMLRWAVICGIMSILRRYLQWL